MRTLATLAAIALAAGTVQAQCLLFDNVNGPCCSAVTPTLPTFPATSLTGLSICWDSCNPTQSCSTVLLSAPTSVLCGQYTAVLNTTDCAGNAELTGVLQLDYARTFDEFPVPGQVLQVWRFLVKADLSLGGTGGGCSRPSCLPSHPTAFYYGYLDYAFDCAAGTWESVLVLYHGCDRYQHDPFFSSRPGSFHPTRSYALVAPSTAANPFVPSVAAPGGGALFAEGIRDTVDLVTLGCEAEEFLVTGGVTPIASACVCPLSPSPPQVTARSMRGLGTCGSDFRSVNLYPVLPWFEVLATSIGTWTTATTYPGAEAVWVDEGAFLHTEACTLTGAFEFYAEVKVGATTEGGYLATAGPVAGDKFVDLVNNFSADLTGPILPPFFGSVMTSRHLIDVNYP